MDILEKIILVVYLIIIISAMGMISLLIYAVWRFRK